MPEVGGRFRMFGGGLARGGARTSGNPWGDGGAGGRRRTLGGECKNGGVSTSGYALGGGIGGLDVGNGGIGGGGGILFGGGLGGWASAEREQGGE